MSPLVIGAIALLVVVAIFVVWRATRFGHCASSSDCPAGLACIGGACVTPPAGCNPPCTAPATCINGACVALGCYPPCTAPATCQSGTCVTPARASCYQWTPWNPTAEKGAPTWAVGTDFLVPVGVQNPTSGEWYLGATDGDATEHDYGEFIPASAAGKALAGTVPATYYAVKATGTCPSVFAAGSNPAQALQFHGAPVCYSSNAMFSPWAAGSCDDSSGMGPWALVQDATS